MLKNFLKVGAIIFCALLLQKTAFAGNEVELPHEELATESVLPVFDKSVSVKNRAIKTANRWDSNLFYSYAMTEPIANVSKIGFSAYYNFHEARSIGFLYARNFAGLSSYADQLKQQYSFDFNRAPQPQNTFLLDYNVKAFYGKMSLAKSMVINTILHGSLAGGVIQYEHKIFPAVVLGIGEKFYLNKSWALRFDMRLYTSQAPIPFKANALKSTDPKPTADQFDERITFTTTLDAGLSYIF